MNRDEAIAIIRKEYLCADRDCDIERSCGKCDLMMPSKEPILQAYKIAIKALEHPEQNVIAVVPCGDAISRQEALKLFATNDGKYLYEAIRDLPSVTPQEPKTGHWIDEGWYAEGHSEHAYRCSECDEQYIGYVGEYKHCPNCGAKMESEER